MEFPGKLISSSMLPSWPSFDSQLLYPLRLQVNGSLQVRLHVCVCFCASMLLS